MKAKYTTMSGEETDVGVVDAEIVLELLNLVSTTGAVVDLLLDVESALWTDVNILVELCVASRTAVEHLRSKPLCAIMGICKVVVGWELLGEADDLQDSLTITGRQVTHGTIII